MNLFRWLKEYFLVWGFLTSIYSITLALLLEPVLQLALPRGSSWEPSIFQLWLLTVLSLLVPACLNRIPGSLPGLGRVRALLPAQRGFSLIYFRHESRRLAVGLTLLLTAGLAPFFGPDRLPIWLMIGQLPLQRALFSVRHWQRLALGANPRSGGTELLRVLTYSQLAQWAVVVTVAAVLSGWSAEIGWRVAVAGAGGLLAGACVALEGDAGRPWIVNFVSLAAGALGALLSWAWPVSVAVIAYFAFSMIQAVGLRLRSLELLDEDTLIP